MRHLARRQKAGETAHLPNLVILARGFFENARRNIGADVEHEHVDRPDVAFDRLDQRHDLIFFARVRAERMRDPTGLLDLCDQRRQLVGIAAGDADRESFGRETPRDGAAGSIAGANNQRNLCRHDLR